MDEPEAFIVKKANKKCSVCKRVSLRPRTFLIRGVVTHFCYKCTKLHKKTPLGPDDKDTKYLCCEDCSEIFSTFRALQHHSKTQHGLEKPEFPCPLCENKSYTTKFRFEQHYRNHHEDESSQSKASTSKELTDDDHQKADETRFSSETEIESYFLPETKENPLLSISPNDQLPHSNASSSSEKSTPKNPRKCRGSKKIIKPVNTCNGERLGSLDDVSSQPSIEMQTWCSALAMTLAKMPPVDQIEMKMAISSMVGNRELKILKNNYRR